MKLRENFPVIVIHCPQKVGSTGLTSSLRLFALHKYDIIHIHDERIFPFLGISPDIKTVAEFIHWLCLTKQVIVIQIYKKPIERIISCFFEHITSFHYNTTEQQVNQYSIDKLSKRFNQIFFHIDEWNGSYGPEAYISNENLKVIELIVLDDLQTTRLQWMSILSKELNLPIFIIIDRPTTLPIYKQFKKEYKIPLIILNQLQQSPEMNRMNKYFNQNEINNYFENWRIKSIDNIPYCCFTKEQYQLYYEISTENQVNNEINYNHYTDDGCVCNNCMNKRLFIIQNIYQLNKKNIIPIIKH